MFIKVCSSSRLHRDYIMETITPLICMLVNTSWNYLANTNCCQSVIMVKALITKSNPLTLSSVHLKCCMHWGTHYLNALLMSFLCLFFLQGLPGPVGIMGPKGVRVSGRQMIMNKVTPLYCTVNGSSFFQDMSCALFVLFKCFSAIHLICQLFVIME